MACGFIVSCSNTITEAALLPGVDGWEGLDIKWSDPPNNWRRFCHKVTTVFKVPVCVSKEAFRSRDKCDHVVRVFYQLLDNDENGIVDDRKVWKEMVDEGYALLVPKDEDDFETVFDDYLPGTSIDQMTGIWEAAINSCDVPANRGADPEDRSTWAGNVGLNGKDCDRERDATVEEILHLITHAAGAVYPSKWGPNYQSEAGKAISDANGNCGWGYLGNWINPGGNRCEGQYAYNDRTCDEECIVVEGIYWAIISYMGGLYTNDRAEWTSDEWLMATPDKSMPVLPEGRSNAISLQEGSPALYSLVSGKKPNGQKWLPRRMPDGIYSRKCHRRDAIKTFEVGKGGKTIDCGFVADKNTTRRCKLKLRNSPNGRVFKRCPVTCGLVGVGPCSFLEDQQE